MPVIISAIVFLLFAGVVSNPAKQPTGQDFVPGLGQGPALDCIPADASSGTKTLFGIPKATKDNVAFVNTPPCFEASDPRIINAPDYNCGTNPWDNQPYPDVADYVTVVNQIVITDVWPHADTTRLAKQILPQTGEPYYQPNFDQGDFRDQIYRATCNDWCLFTPPRRSPALPYGGTFFCDFIFLYQGQNVGGQLGPRKYTQRNGANYPDDTATTCNEQNNFEDCPIFDILLRAGAPVPDSAGGAAPGAKVTPLRCDLKNPTPAITLNLPLKKPLTTLKKTLISLLSPYLPNSSPSVAPFAWPETATAQTETFINLVGNHDAKGEWILAGEKTTLAGKVLDTANGRQQIPEPPPIVFRGKDYEAFYNLISTLSKNKNLLYLVEIGKVAEADNARRNNNLNYVLPFIEFRRSPDMRPGGKTLQLGTFPVVTAKGWWELFPEESKPAIYLYPEKPIALNVKLETKGRLTVSDPPYDPATGWNVLAHPDGSLKPLNHTLNKPLTYPYLYYEAILDEVFVEKTGFLVPGPDLKNWFLSTLPTLGLNKTETADFIDYWMSRLNKNQPYYFVHFLSDQQIEQLEPVTIKPLNHTLNLPLTTLNKPLTPDTAIRIRPYFKPLSAQAADNLQITPQSLTTPPQRSGFTLVEWGGILVE